MIIIVDRLLRNNSWAAANAVGPVILLLRAHQHNRGLIAHERWHVLLWWLGLIVFGGLLLLLCWHMAWPLYLALLGSCVKPLLTLIPWVLFWEEAVAYAIQCSVNGVSTVPYARILSERYAVDRSVEQAQRAIDSAQQWLTARGWFVKI